MLKQKIKRERESIFISSSRKKKRERSLSKSKSEKEAYQRLYTQGVATTPPQKRMHQSIWNRFQYWNIRRNDASRAWDECWRNVSKLFSHGPVLFLPVELFYRRKFIPYLVWEWNPWRWIVRPRRLHVLNVNQPQDCTGRSGDCPRRI